MTVCISCAGDLLEMFTGIRAEGLDLAGAIRKLTGVTAESVTTAGLSSLSVCVCAAVDACKE